MSEVTFTPEQVKEIRRRVVASMRGEVYYPGKIIDAILAAFPLPKVTRYRTFKRLGWTYRVNDGTVEYHMFDVAPSWYPAAQSIVAFAKSLAENGEWTALAALADVAARPTEEVDA